MNLPGFGPHKRLTAKEMAFVRHYLRTGSAIEAYRLAGYYHKKGHNWEYDWAQEILGRPRVQGALAGIMEERVEENKLTMQQVADKFMNIYNVALEKEDHTNANRALENLGKWLGMFVEKKEVTNKNYTMDEEDNKEEIERLARAAGVVVDFKANVG